MPRRHLPAIFAAALLAHSATLSAQAAQRDHVEPMDSAGLSCIQRASDTLTLRALATFAGATDRFGRGLPAGSNLYVTYDLHGPPPRIERIFVRVTAATRDSLFGVIASPIVSLPQFHLNDPIRVARGAILDWTIGAADGHEEGNLLGTLIDSVQARRMKSPRASLCELLVPPITVGGP